MDKRVYHPLISDLEEKVSYGTLGILESFVHRFNDPIHLKRNVLLINGDTIIRNCYNKESSLKAMDDQISLDFDKLFYYFQQYSPQSTIIVYFHPSIHALIHKDFQKKLTPVREALSVLSLNVVKSDDIPFNKPKLLMQRDNLSIIGLAIKGKFIYRALDEYFHSLLMKNKIWMISHCSMDYLLFNRYDINLINSHTGVILSKNDLSKKVFGDETIVFNKTTLKLFGDKEFIRPICRNKPKALSLLKSYNLRLITERELMRIAIEKLGINKASLLWDM